MVHVESRRCRRGRFGHIVKSAFIGAFFDICTTAAYCDNSSVVPTSSFPNDFHFHQRANSDLYFRGWTVMDSRSARSLFSASIAAMIGLKYRTSCPKLAHDLILAGRISIVRLRPRVSSVPPRVITDGLTNTARAVNMYTHAKYNFRFV